MFTGAIEHPVLRFLPHAVERSTTTPIDEDPQAALLEWLRVIAAWKLLAKDRHGSRVGIHRVISDRLKLSDGIYAAASDGTAGEFALAERVSHEMKGLTHLVPLEFAGYIRRDNDTTL